MLTLVLNPLFGAPDSRVQAPQALLSAAHFSDATEGNQNNMNTINQYTPAPCHCSLRVYLSCATSPLLPSRAHPAQPTGPKHTRSYSMACPCSVLAFVGPHFMGRPVC